MSAKPAFFAPGAGQSLAGGVLLLLAAAPLVLDFGDYTLGLLVSALVISGLALSWALLGNLGGMISFGYAAFFGVGAYTSALASARLGVPVALAVPLGGVVAALSAISMLPTLRLSGPYFALAILAYAQIFRILATEASSITGGSTGLQRYPGLPKLLGFDLSTRSGAYVVVLGAVALFACVYSAIRRSHIGTALRAIAHSEIATRVVGVDSLRLKAAMLFLSAFMAGVFGALNAHVIGFLDPDYAFGGQWSVMPVIAAVFGGYHTVLGPVFGAMVIYLFDQIIAKSFIPVGHEILLGFVLAFMVLIAPNGIAGLAGTLIHRLRERRGHAAT